MNRLIGSLIVATLLVAPARADDTNAVVDKAIKALGGEAKLAKAGALKWTAKGKITFNDNSNEFTSHVIVRGLDHYRSEFEGEFNGNTVKGVTIVNGDKGWRKFNDNFMEIEGDMLTNEKRTIYLQVVPTLLLPLKGKDFKVEPAGDQNVDGKPAAALKVTGPDGRDFTLCFDKESGLPVKQTATVVGFGGQEFEQETLLGNYKDFEGIKKATKIENKRNGERFIDVEVTEFSALDKADDEAFAEPK